MNSKPILNNGFSIIEAIVGVAIAAVLLVTFLTLIIASRRIMRSNSEELKAALYLREAVEVARDLETSDWDPIAGTWTEFASCMTPAICHPQVSGSIWTLASDSEALDEKYTRLMIIYPVYRNDIVNFPNEIVASTTVGAVLDPNTLKVSASISWNGEWGDKERILETYVYSPR